MNDDDLRTRIAAAALNAYAGTETAWDMSEGDVRRKDWLEIADAVIRELGLQTHLAKRIINGKSDQWVRRHVTDWEIVE